MALPETIPVKYTEEEAEYLSVRPVVRQTFRLRELVDMILAVTGKDAARVQQILRSGTTVFHSYRYWWQGFEAPDEDLAHLLAEFPDPQPHRPFRMEECTRVMLETATGRASLVIERAIAARRGLLRRRSLWDCLADWVTTHAPRYADYSYEQHADRFTSDVNPEEWVALRDGLLRSGTRSLHNQLSNLPAVARILYLCPRA